MLLFPKIIVFLWISIEYIYQVKAENIENKLTIPDIAQDLTREHVMSSQLPRHQMKLFKQVWDITDRNEPVANMREEIKPIAEKLITSQVGTSINPEVMDRHLKKQMKMFDSMIEENNRFHSMINLNEDKLTAAKIKELDKEIQTMSFNVSLGGKHVELKHNDIYDEYSNLLNSYDNSVVLKWFRYKNNVNPEEMAKPKHSPISDSNDNDTPIRDVNPVDTPVKTSKNGLRPIPISFNSQAILYLFPQKYHRGTAKVIHFYQKDICYILSGDEACHQNVFAHSCKACIDYTPLSAMTYLPPDWCICFSDESDCSGYNACWPNFGYTVDLSSDGFKHIRSISIISGPVCQTRAKKLSKAPTLNIEGLECHPTRQNNVIGDGFDDYSMVQSPNLPSPYIQPNHNHMILQLFDRKWHTGNGTIFSFFKGDVCYNIKTCNIVSPSSAYVYAPKCWSVCFSKDEDCKGLTKCCPNYGWPADLHYDGLAGLKSFAIYDRGCYEFSGSNITETRASKIAESCV